MISTLHRSAAVLFATAVVSSLGTVGTVVAQNVLVSEVRADGERWVELHNRSGGAVDLSSWSLHYATLTVGMPKNYWWPFPAGTVMAAGGYLRVHWFQSASGAVAPGDLWTGTSPYGFLFGLGGEQLLASRGAFALFRSQDNALMNTASIIEDWVSWGGNGFQREGLAVQVGLWAAGRFLPAVPPSSSLARDPVQVGTVAFPDLAWFVDASPTPLGPNATGAVVQSYGAACVLPGNHLLGLPVLSVPSLPLVGNPSFGFTVENTTGVWGEFVLFAFGVAAAPAGTPGVLPPFAGVTCSQAIDLQGIAATWLVSGQILGTSVPLSMAGVPASAVGAELHVQALVLDLVPFVTPPFQGVSNALRLVVGQ
ncbi:MAG: lamin tail domain-containing protein [Planctomycetota bacterium]